MAKPKDSIDSLLTLPYTELIDGKPYVRLVYRDERTGRRRTGRRRFHSVADYAPALENLKKRIGARPADYDPEKITFEELLTEFKKAKKIPEWYEKPIKEHFSKQRLKTITYGDLKEFKEKREAVRHKVTKEPRKPATINRELEFLREVLLYAIRHEWLAKNPFNKGETLIPKSEEESRHRIPSLEEEAAILEWCWNFETWIRRKAEAKGISGHELAEAIGAEAMARIEAGKGIKDADISAVALTLDEPYKAAWEIARGRRSHLRPILIALRDTGLRKSALLSLTWSQVDLAEGFLKIPKGPRNKKRPPLIAITDRLKEELLKLWEKSDRQPTSQIFGGIKDFKKAWGRICELAGVTDLHIHDWRHRHATDLAEGGVDERLALIALGHSNSETHAIYTNLDKRLAREIAEKLNKLHEDRERKAEEPPAASELIN